MMSLFVGEDESTCYSRQIPNIPPLLRGEAYRQWQDTPKMHQKEITGGSNMMLHKSSELPTRTHD